MILNHIKHEVDINYKYGYSYITKMVRYILMEKEQLWIWEQSKQTSLQKDDQREELSSVKSIIIWNMLMVVIASQK